MLRTIVRSPVPVRLVTIPSRFFSPSTARNALKIELEGTAKGLKQSLNVLGEGHVNHVINTDCFESLGGTDLHPDPIQLLYSSISGCQNITANLVAKDNGINIGKANVRIQADHNIVDQTPGKYPGFLTSSVTVYYELESDATDKQFEQLREETEAKCPIANVFINSTGLKFTSNWIKVPLNSL